RIYTLFLHDALPISGLLPALSTDELLLAASIASVAGKPLDGVQGATRPFRAPHHTTSAYALVGGGPRPRPGEVSLAHHGVLFLRSEEHTSELQSREK